MSSTERSTATGKPRPGVLHRGFMVATQAIDHRIGWDKLPKPLGLLVLIGLRDTLREKNLHDTNAAPAQTTKPPKQRWKIGRRLDISDPCQCTPAIQLRF